MHDPVSYDDEYVRDLFDRMGSTYDLVNHVSSLGFCRWWRIECVDRAEIRSGDVVCDLMAGGGECWQQTLLLCLEAGAPHWGTWRSGRRREYPAEVPNTCRLVAWQVGSQSLSKEEILLQLRHLTGIVSQR